MTPFFAIGAALVVGGIGGAVEQTRRFMDAIATYDAQHPWVTIETAEAEAKLREAAAIATQTRTDRLERCVQDGLGLETYRIVEPTFDVKAQTAQFILSDGRTDMFMDLGLTEATVQSQKRQPLQIAMSACQHYVYDGDWSGAKRAIQSAHFKPARLLHGG